MERGPFLQGVADFLQVRGRGLGLWAGLREGGGIRRKAWGNGR